VLLDRGVEVEPPHPNGQARDHPAHRDHGHLAGATADVHDQVPDGFVDRETRADRGGERLLDEDHPAAAGGPDGLVHGPAFDL
jgi:hypothetical protein